jgi:putative glutamine amidotransferase
LIGLTGRRKQAADLAGMPESLHHLDGDWFFADYARGVLAAGGLPVQLPLDVAPAAYVGSLDGIVLSGGADVDAGRYGATAHPATMAEPIRDEFELTLLDAAATAGLPVLGICRGLQVLNVYAGGTLHQDVPSHARYDVDPASLTNRISLSAGSQLADLYGTEIEANSLHHQTVDVLGEKLQVTARADDGTIEGLEHESLPIIAVQWHPEMLRTRDSDPAFTWIVEQARARSTAA